MENLIYILAPLAYFLLQGYQNYKKEQEKARQRQIDLQKKMQNLQKMSKNEPVVIPVQETVEYKFDYNLQQEQERQKKISDAMLYQQAKADDYYNPELTSFKKALPKKEESKPSKPLQTISLEEEKEFDLRDAIIKEAILNRPY